MKYEVESIGCELEYGDIDTRIKLPKGLTWDMKDYSICNSNGTANDPHKEIQRYGSEIHTEPVGEISELLFLVCRFQEANKTQIHLNYTTNFHVHIRVPGLRDDLGALKKLAKYYRKYAERMFARIEPIPIPLREEYTTQKAFNGAWRRYKRRHRSHQMMVSENKFDRMMEAKTPEEFNLAHYPLDYEDRPLTHLYQREGVNLAHLWKPTETIEFRHFTMTRDKNKLYSALLWPKLYLNAALYTEETPDDILRKHKHLEFQRFFKYDYKKDRIFRLTNLNHKSRAEVRRIYERLIKEGILKEEDYLR